MSAVGASPNALHRFRAAALRRERARLGLAAVALAAGLISGGSILVSLLRRLDWIGGWIGGWIGRWDWTAETLSLAAAIVVSSGILAALLPVREVSLVRRIDRRLGLEAALITALEVEGSADPICRLLVGRTASALEAMPLSRAVPLRPPAAAFLVPALLVLALGMSAHASPGASPTASGPDAALADPLDLSRQIQALAAAMLFSREPGHAGVVDSARKLLEVEAAVRSGRLTPMQAREALAELADSPALGSGSVQRPGVTGSPGTGDANSAAPPSPGRGWRLALLALARGEAGDAGLGDLGGGAGAGDTRGAGGRGAARLEMEEETPGAGPAHSPGSASWFLPAPSRGVGRNENEAGPRETRATEDLSTPEPIDEASGTRLTSPARPLTASERLLVEAYFDALRRPESRTVGSGLKPAPPTREEAP